MLDSNMTMSQHVLHVCQNCYFQIRLIRRLGKALSVESNLLLVHALVHNRLDYCDSVLVRLPWSLVQHLQSLLNLLLVWFLAWSALITLHLPWLICIGFHTRSALHTNCVWSCFHFDIQVFIWHGSEILDKAFHSRFFCGWTLTLEVCCRWSSRRPGHENKNNRNKKFPLFGTNSLEQNSPSIAWILKICLF